VRIISQAKLLWNFQPAGGVKVEIRLDFLIACNGRPPATNTCWHRRIDAAEMDGQFSRRVR
jgi:hypothetical protein